MSDLREKILIEMRRRGITQRELASRLGVTPMSVWKFLRGNDPRLSTIERIMSVCGIEYTDLFAGKEPEPIVETFHVDGYVNVNGFITHVTSIEELQAVARQASAFEAQQGV